MRTTITETKQVEVGYYNCIQCGVPLIADTVDKTKELQNDGMCYDCVDEATEELYVDVRR